MTTARPPLVTRQQIGDIAIEVDAECGTMALDMVGVIDEGWDYTDVPSDCTGADTYSAGVET